MAGKGMQIEVDESALQKYLVSLNQAIKDDQDDIALKNSELYLAQKPDEDIQFCKIVALAKLGKYQQAQQVLANFKRVDEDTKFIKAYLAYRLGHYQEAMDLAESAGAKSIRMTLLRGQVSCKRENYEMACNIFANILQEKTTEVRDIYEEVCANFFNALALYAWNLVSSKKTVTLSAAMKTGLSTALEFASTKFEEITVREVYLNLCILLAIDISYGAGLFTHDETNKYSREFLEKFKAIYARGDDAMDEETDPNGQLNEEEKDLLISKVIEVIFERRRHRVKIHEGDLAKIESEYHRLGEEDHFLKASVLSYILYMKMNTNNPTEIHVITKEAETILVSLKKSKLTKKLQEIISTNLHFNKAISLLLRGKFQDVKELELSNDQWDNLSIKAYVLTKNKRIEDIEKLAIQVQGASARDKFLIALLQLGAYHQLNNQNLYQEKFVHFMNTLVLPEYKQSNGLFNQLSFREFFNSLVKYIFKNSGLLLQMKSSVKDLVSNFDDVEILHTIAENFAQKKDYASSEDIYRRILQIEPENDKAKRKSQHFLAMRDPSQVTYDELPQVTLIDDYERLRQIEVDFLQYKGAGSKTGAHSSTRHNIRWSNQ
jgi:Putative TPR-like repeat